MRAWSIGNPAMAGRPSRINFMAQWDKDYDNPTLTSFLKLLQERYPLLPSSE